MDAAPAPEASTALKALAVPATGARRAPRVRSLATRLIVAAVSLAVAVLLVAGVLLSLLYQRAAERGFDERLHVYLKVLVADLAAASEAGRPDGVGAEPPTLGEPRFELPLSGWYWQVTRVDGEEPRVVRTSRSLFAARLPVPEVARREPGAPAPAPSLGGGARETYATGPEERRIRLVERVVDLGEEGRFQVSVAGDAEDIAADGRRFDLLLGTTFALLAAALAASTFAGVRIGLRPLERLLAALGAVRRGEAERIAGAYPREVAPLAAELNLLVDANHAIVERARTAAGNLAHALKTPLSVLVNEADRDPTPLAAKVREQAGVMNDQVRYHLDRASAAARAGAIGTTTEVGPVVAGLARTFQKIHADRALRVEAEVEPGARFRGERQDLEEMLGNLVDNAAKWADGRVRVTATRRAPIARASDAREARAALVLTVDDDGPGLPAADRAEAVRRGRRLDETRPGSGLGLAIVTDLAALHGGDLALEDGALGGLRARLTLPAV